MADGTGAARLGIFGGAFDPIHNGHLFIAEAVRVEIGLERVLFVPNREGRHREPAIAPAADRAAMIRHAIAANPALGLDETELEPDASGYTVDLLPRLRRRYPDAELTFIAGGDSLVRSPWRGLDQVLTQLAEFVVAPRGTVSRTDLDAALAHLDAPLRNKVRLLDLPLIAASATLVRDRLAAGKSIRYLVPEPVYRHIEEVGLYRPLTAPT